MSRRPAVTLALAATALVCTPRASLAQDAGYGSATDVSAPLRPRLAWSPLVPIAEAGRGGPAAAALPGLLTEPVPDAGLFTFAANPGAAALELDSATLRDVRAEHQSLSGAFRRPLDPERVSTTAVSIFGRQPLGSRGAAAGHARFARRDLSGSTFALGTEPYRASPLIPTDTTAPPMAHSTARIEGVLGWRLGETGVGFATGVELTDARAGDARIGRIVRVANPALSAGVVRRLPLTGIRAGLHARGAQRTERVTTVPLVAPEVVRQLEGMFEVESKVLGNSPYFRRFERRSLLVGASLAGTVFDTRWVALAERGGTTERQSSAQQANPPEDRWTARTTRVAGVLQRQIAGRLVATAFTDFTTTTGEANRADLNGFIYRTSGRQARVAADVRVQLSPATRLALAGWTMRDQRDVNDALANLRTEIVTWTPGGAMEVARPLGRSISASLGAAMSLHAPVARIPAGQTLGPVFRQFFAPELEWYAAGSRSESAAATVRGQLGAQVVWVRLAGERLVPSKAGGVAPFRPEGTRTAVHATIGVEF